MSGAHISNSIKTALANTVENTERFIKILDTSLNDLNSGFKGFTDFRNSAGLVEDFITVSTVVSNDDSFSIKSVIKIVNTLSKEVLSIRFINNGNINTSNVELFQEFFNFFSGLSTTTINSFVLCCEPFRSGVSRSSRKNGVRKDIASRCDDAARVFIIFSFIG